MFTSNPFSELSALISTDVMQVYLIVMAVLVAAGTILDMIHKKSAQYFFENAEKAKKSAKRSVGVGEKAGIAIATVANEVLTSGEFCNTKRRLSHLLTMYGFIIFVATTAMMIFGWPSEATIATSTLALLWHIGAIMLCLGGYWCHWCSPKINKQRSITLFLYFQHIRLFSLQQVLWFLTQCQWCALLIFPIR